MLLGIEYATGLLGFFLAFPLIAMTRSRPANGWLGLFILSISLLTLAFPVYARFPQLFGLFDWPLAGVGAFFYCYVRSLTGLGNARRQRWHFMPLALFSGVLIYARCRSSGIGMLDMLSGRFALLFSTLLLAFQVLAAGYALAALYRLRQYRRRLREHYASVEQRELVWLSWLCMTFIALLIVWFPSNLIGGVWQVLLIFGRLINLYFVGWFGLQQTAFSVPPSPANPPHPIISEPIRADDQPLVAPSVEPALPIRAHADAKYARSGMNEAVSELIGKRLERWVKDERGFLDPDIRLIDLAGRIGTSPQLLSQYLNTVSGLNFFDYINRLRIAEVQGLMCDPANDGRTLLELAFAAGFTSKSTFNTAFKKISGLAPSSWRNEHARTSAPTG